MTTVLRRWLVAFATALAVVANAAVPGVGSATFSIAVDLSAPLEHALFPQVAVGPDGATTITWYHYNGTHYIIQAATRPAGSATFGTPVDLSASGQNAAPPPQVAVGPDGATTITWRRSNGTNEIIQAATRPAGSATFSAAVDLSAIGQDALNPQVAVGPDGATTITWYRSNIIQAATRPAGSATFSTAVNLSAPSQNTIDPQVAVGPDGATTITWYRSSGTNDIIQAATRTAGSATFSAAVDLSAPLEFARDPQVAVGPDGATTITWLHYNNVNWIIQARTRPALSATFSTAVNLSAPLGSAFSPQVAIGPDGATTITWYRSNGTNDIIQVATRTAGSATFSAAVDLSAPSGNADSPQVAVGPDGATIITWYRSNGSEYIIQAATRPAGSATFGTPVDLSAPSGNAYDPQVAVGPDGATTITWYRSNGTNYIIQASSRGLAPVRLSVTTDGSGAGSVTSVPAGINCGATCDAYFAIGSTATLTATAASGSVHTGWSGGGTGTSSTRVVTLNTATSVTATFGVAPAPAKSEVAAAFKVLSVKAGRTALRSRVTLRGPGVLSQKARSTGSKRVRVCVARKKVSRASTVWLLCPLTRATKRALLNRSLRVRVVTTFTPTGGVAQVHTKIIRLGARRATTAGTG